MFSSARTGAATAVTREDLATLPTISGRITDITRLTPQYGGSGTFAGQDNRANNMTVDGSYFNNSFGLGVTTGGIGDRTGVAPISLEAIEQVQVSVAPYDVRQGNFTGAGVNTVTRSGTNSFTASVYHRTRNESYVGTDAARPGRSTPARSTPTTTGVWAGGPIVKNKLFAFGAYEKQDDTRPLTTFTSNPGGAPVAGNTTRVLASDLTALSSFLSTNFNYDTGPFDNIPKITPAKPWMVKGDYNVNSANKVTFRYNQLDSSSRRQPVGLVVARHEPSDAARRNFLTFANSNYAILENLKSGVGEWNSVFGNMTNNLLVGYTHQDESRGDKGQTPLFPFVVIGDGAGSALHVVRQRAVHAVQPAPLQHVPGAGQRDEVREEPLDHLRRQPREVPLGQLVLLRHPERLLVQHAGRLLHRRQRLPREPEPHGVAGQRCSASR